MGASNRVASVGNAFCNASSGFKPAAVSTALRRSTQRDGRAAQAFAHHAAAAAGRAGLRERLV